MTRIGLWLLASCMGLVGSSVAAQTDPTPADGAHRVTGESAAAPDEAGNVIVVTGDGEPATRSETYEQARDVSRVGGYQLDEEPLARFAQPLCPQVSGLKADVADAMAARIRGNAGRLGVKLAGANCSPNLIVAFVEDGQKKMADLADASPRLFCTLPASEQSELLAEEAPVRVWNRIVVVGEKAHVWRCRWNVTAGGHTSILLPFRKDIVSSVVMFDRDVVAGMPLIQLADYATMRGLSHTRPPSGEHPMETILALFNDGASQPEELTSFDVGYLRSLYWWKPNQRASGMLLGVRARALREEESPPASVE